MNSIKNKKIIAENKIARSEFFKRLLQQIELEKKEFKSTIPTKEFFDKFITEIEEYFDFEDQKNREVAKYCWFCDNINKGPITQEEIDQLEIKENKIYIAKKFDEILRFTIWQFEDDIMKLHDWTTDFEFVQKTAMCLKNFADFALQYEDQNQNFNSHHFKFFFANKLYIWLLYKTKLLKHLIKNKNVNDKIIWPLLAKNIDVSEINKKYTCEDELIAKIKSTIGRMFYDDNIGSMYYYDTIRNMYCYDNSNRVKKLTGVQLSPNLFLVITNFNLVKFYKLNSYRLFIEFDNDIVCSETLCFGPTNGKKIKNQKNNFIIFKTDKIRKQWADVETGEFNITIIFYYSKKLGTTKNVYQSENAIIENELHGHSSCPVFSDNGKLIEITNFLDNNDTETFKMSDIMKYLENYCGVVYNSIINKSKFEKPKSSIFKTLFSSNLIHFK